MVKFWSDTVTQFYGIRLMYAVHKVKLDDGYIFFLLLGLWLFSLSPRFVLSCWCSLPLLFMCHWYIRYIRFQLIPIEWYSKHVLIH